MATRLGGRTLVEYQFQVSACFCYIYIYMWNIVWNMKHENASKTHIYIYMRNIVWNIIFIKFHRNTYIYMRNIAWNIQIAYGLLKKTQKLIRRNHIYIWGRSCGILFFAKSLNIYHFGSVGLAKSWTFTIFHSPMFAKSLQKSSKHVQPRNSSVEYLWNIKKCSFEGFRSPGGSCLKACSCHVGGWFV